MLTHKDLTLTIMTSTILSEGNISRDDDSVSHLQLTLTGNQLKTWRITSQYINGDMDQMKLHERFTLRLALNRATFRDMWWCLLQRFPTSQMLTKGWGVSHARHTKCKVCGPYACTVCFTASTSHRLETLMSASFVYNLLTQDAYQDLLLSN